MELSRHVLSVRRSGPETHTVQPDLTLDWWHDFGWVGAAAVIGFLLTAITAGVFELSRQWIVLIHAVVTISLVISYVWWSQLDWESLLRHHWRVGALGGVVVGVIVVAAVLGEEATERPTGGALIWDLIWLGVVYGLLDALLLNVLPVLATWRAFEHRGWTEHWEGKVVAGMLAVVASLLVTAAYHLGYPEFRDSDIGSPLIGNTIISIGYVLTNNPLTAIISHIAMHVAAVWQGAEGVQQLPPHY